MNNAPGTEGIPNAAMLRFYTWRRAINTDNVDPKTAAAGWDAHFEQVGDHYTIRLNQQHRVHFNIDWEMKRLLCDKLEDMICNTKRSRSIKIWSNSHLKGLRGH